jgi:hypothetical protein
MPSSERRRAREGEGCRNAECVFRLRVDLSGNECEEWAGCLAAQTRCVIETLASDGTDLPLPRSATANEEPCGDPRCPGHRLWPRAPQMNGRGRAPGSAGPCLQDTPRGAAAPSTPLSDDVGDSCGEGPRSLSPQQNASGELQPSWRGKPKVQGRVQPSTSHNIASALPRLCTTYDPRRTSNKLSVATLVPAGRSTRAEPSSAVVLLAGPNVSGGGKFDSCGGRKSDSRQRGLAAG